MRLILNNVLNNSVTDSTDIAFEYVSEIVNSSFESAQKAEKVIKSQIVYQ